MPYDASHCISFILNSEKPNYNRSVSSESSKAHDSAKAPETTTTTTTTTQLVTSEGPIATSDLNQGSFLLSLKPIKLHDIVPLMTPTPTAIGDLDTYNNIHIFPRLSSIINMPYFRFVKLNLAKKCTLWHDDSGKCSERNCRIEFCKETDLPPQILMDDVNNGNSYTHNTKNNDNGINSDGDKLSSNRHKDDYLDCHEQEKLSQINNTISYEHEQSMDSLFECTYDEDGQYIDLLLNPERYTGYSGNSAHRIWRSIYEENCFFNHLMSNQLISKNPFSMLDSLCYEERIFYRAISGLHTSINIHLCSYFPQKALTSSSLDSQLFTYNLPEFVRRFKGKTNYLTNLYFVYLLELRALAKVEKYLTNYVNWQSTDDGETSIATTRDAIKSLLKVIKKAPASFDESGLFNSMSNSNYDFSLPSIAYEFAGHFKNITSNIMDCVACDKCKLWGKIQTHGLGTAFKILTTHESVIAAATGSASEMALRKEQQLTSQSGVKPKNTLTIHRNKSRFHLSRHEITCLINGIAKLSQAIQFLEKFNNLLAQPPQQKQTKDYPQPPIFSSKQFKSWP